MLKVPIPDDIRSQKTYVISHLTIRNIVCSAIGLAYSIPILKLLSLDIGNTIFAFMFLMTPAVVAGWVDIYKMPSYKFVWTVLRDMMLNPVCRKYKEDDNEITEEIKERNNASVAQMNKELKEIRKKKRKKKYDPEEDGYM